MSAELVAGLHEAFGRGDIPAVREMLDPQVRWREA